MSRAADILADVYARVPRINCKGLCSECCGPIMVHEEEARRMERRAGRPLACSPEGRCGYLGQDNRCTVYRVRPYVCRVWGVTEGMECPFGCEPERIQTRAESYRPLQLMVDLLGDRMQGPDLRSNDV